jgi:phospholipid transport system substrate-binding protein
MENGQIMIGEKARLLAVIAWLLLLFAIGVSEGAAMGQRHSNGYAQGPTAQIKGTVDRTIRILSDPNLKGDGKNNLRHQLAREAILPRFDFNEMAKRSLGSHWRRLTAEEQRKFVSVFSQFLEKIYITRIDAFNGEKFIYTGEQVDQDYARVDSKVQIATGKEYSIRYKLHLVANDWKIYDVVVENISIVNNYRAQFSRIIDQSSYEQLVYRMEQKLTGKLTN